MKIEILPVEVSVSRLSSTSFIPDWVKESLFYSVTRTSDEISIVCESQYVPKDVKSEDGWSILKILDLLNFDLTGILSSIIVPLGDNRISVFAISTYNTDYILVKQDKLEEAIEILKRSFEVIR